MIKFLADVRESLGSITSTAKDWDDRHTLREIQPRWTRDDEAAYGEEILIWKRKSTANLRVVERMEKRIDTRIEHIKQLREWLLNDLNLKEARLSNRSADVSNPVPPNHLSGWPEDNLGQERQNIPNDFLILRLP